MPDPEAHPSETGQRSNKGPALLSRILGRRDASEEDDC